MSYDIQRIRELEIYLKRDEIVQWQPCFKGLSEGWYYRRAEGEEWKYLGETAYRAANKLYELLESRIKKVRAFIKPNKKVMFKLSVVSASAVV